MLCGFLTHRACEIINVCGFKLLSLWPFVMQHSTIVFVILVAIFLDI